LNREKDHFDPSPLTAMLYMPTFGGRKMYQTVVHLSR